MTDKRKDCPMRHENGNCTVAGGFCTAVNDPVCEALHNAFDSGYRSAIRQQEHFRDLTKKVEPLTLDELRQMDGEPVWCVSLGAKLSRGDGWYIGVNNWYMSGYGKTWLAYRQKPEEDDHGV